MMTSQGPSGKGSDDVTVVVDVGSGCLRGGLAGEETPRCELPTVLNVSGEHGQEPRYLIERGCVKDWDAVESLIRSLYSTLQVHQESRHALLLTRHVHDPATDAEKFVQMALEGLGADSVYLGTQPVLTLYANGCSDGVVVDCGEGVTQVVPVFQGYAIDHAIKRQDLAGRDITARLQTILANRRPNGALVDMDTAREIKERLCYVPPNGSQEAEIDAGKVMRSFTLPSGDVIDIGEERFKSTEVLFQPTLIGSECLGLSQLVSKSLSACPIDVRGQLYEKIIMAGGTTKTPGICRRLLQDVTELSPRLRVKVVAEKGRQQSAWRGGSVLASLPSFSQMCVNRQDFQEHGASIVRKKLL